jgi:hypothetical protein
MITGAPGDRAGITAAPQTDHRRLIVEHGLQEVDLGLQQIARA